MPIPLSDAASEFAAARDLMVDGQIRPNKVNDPRLLAALRLLPRERFVPAARASLAYADADVLLGHGRVLMEPMVLARLLQTASPRRGERVLVVGAGPGYGACVLASCGAEVVALEENADFAAQAQTLLGEFAPTARLVIGPLADGCPEHAPYDLVVIEGAFAELPPAILAGLKRPGGRLVGVRAGFGRIGQAVLGEMAGEGPGIGMQAVFDAATPVLPGLARAAAFVF